MADTIANKVLSDLRCLSNCTEGEKVVRATFSEKVEVEKGTFPVREVLKAEEALALLETGDKAPILYTVKQGDSLWMIARRHNTRVANIMDLNNLKSENLQLNQKILISCSNPLISVNQLLRK